MGSRGQSVFSVLFLNLKVMFRSILPSPFVLHWFVREKIYCHWKGINDTRNFHSLEFYGTKNILGGCRFLRAIKSSLFIPWWWLLVVCSLLLIFWLFGPTPQFVSISPPSLATLRFCHPSKYFLGTEHGILHLHLFLASQIDYRRPPYPLGLRQSISLPESPVSTEDR